MKKKNDEKRKRFWSKLVDELSDAVLELIICGIFFVIGVLVYWLFGKRIDWNSADPELIALIGFFSVVAIGAVIWIIYKILGKKDK